MKLQRIEKKYKNRGLDKNIETPLKNTFPCLIWCRKPVGIQNSFVSSRMDLYSSCMFANRILYYSSCKMVASSDNDVGGG